MKYRLLVFKRSIEDLVMLPFIAIGRVLAYFNPLQKEYETFFFFPFYHIGGAEKVHLNIAKAIGNKNAIIFFTRKSQNDLFYNEFKSSNCEMRDISKFTDNKAIYFVNLIFRGMISSYINKQKKKPLVFNGQCNFGYKISPWIKKDIPQVELIHSLCSFSYIRIPFLPFITRTVMISKIRIQEHIDLYKRYGIPLHFKDRIQFILNGIDLPHPGPLPKAIQNEMIVLYVGRSTPEKRVHLVAQIASLIRQTEAAIRFQFLGEVKDAIPKEFHSHCEFLGNQSDKSVINDVYTKAHVLILVSDTEGFPMVVMEAMANGLAIVTTSVGEIPLHVKDGINGFLIKDFLDEKKVITESVQFLAKIYRDKTLFSTMSQANIRYAYEHFGMEHFIKAYQQLAAEVCNE